MNVFLFPGQGSQEIGMAADLFKADAAFRDLVAGASEQVGCNLEKLCLRGPERELVRPRYLQPLLVCVSLGYLRHLTAQGIQAGQVLGHSLGEISALAAAGIVTFDDAVAIAAKRGELMEAAALHTPGGMLAALSPEGEKILLRIAQEPFGREIVLANDNAPGQKVLSGPFAALEEAAQLIATEKLGSCRRLAVAGPWHHPWMEPARRAFADELKTIAFQPSTLPLVFNVTGETETDPQTIRQLLARNLVEPVRWRSAMATLRATGNVTLFEIGPGRVLSGLARANSFDNRTKIFNVNNLRGIELAARFR